MRSGNNSRIVMPGKCEKRLAGMTVPAGFFVCSPSGNIQAANFFFLVFL